MLGFTVAQQLLRNLTVFFTLTMKVSQLSIILMMTVELPLSLLIKIIWDQSAICGYIVNRITCRQHI